MNTEKAAIKSILGLKRNLGLKILAPDQQVRLREAIRSIEGVIVLLLPFSF
jgi:hypothetical protein